VNNELAELAVTPSTPTCIKIHKQNTPASTAKKLQLLKLRIDFSKSLPN
jgi:hypothetical protein